MHRSGEKMKTDRGRERKKGDKRRWGKETKKEKGDGVGGGGR